MTAVTDPLGNTTSMIYDADGKIASVTEVRNHTITYGYDPRDRLQTRTDAPPAGYDLVLVSDYVANELRETH